MPGYSGNRLLAIEPKCQGRARLYRVALYRVVLYRVVLYRVVLYRVLNDCE